jgi:hypothetical protein
LFACLLFGKKWPSRLSLPVIRVLVWEECKAPFEKIRQAYQREAACIVQATYRSHSEIMDHLLKGPQKKAAFLESCSLFEIKKNKSFIYSKQVAKPWSCCLFFCPPNRFQMKLKIHPQPLFSWTPERVKESSPTLSFLRFLNAPTKGQVEFALEGWTGISADHWIHSPRLKIYAISGAQDLLNSAIENFETYEGVQMEVSYLKARKDGYEYAHTFES